MSETPEPFFENANNPVFVIDRLFFCGYYRLNSPYLTGLQRDGFQLLAAEALAAQLKDRGVVKDPVQRTEQSGILIEILSPERRILVAGKDHIEVAFLVVATVNEDYLKVIVLDQVKNYIRVVCDLINSMYSKDISKKILTALQTRWKSGINTSTFLPYGYRRTEDKKWEIDPVSGKVVRTVFELAMEGKRIRDICDYLNERQIPTPAEYIMDKDNSDPRTFTLKCKELRWDKSCFFISRRITQRVDC